MCVCVVCQAEGESIHHLHSLSVSETIDSFRILEHPHVAHSHAVVIPWSTKPNSKSVLGSGVDLSWVSFENVLARFIEDIQLLS